MRRKYRTSRLLCFSAIERLERRELLAADLATLIGRRILAPTPTELDTPIDGLFHSGGFELIERTIAWL